jgi:hypothetical protein
MFLQHQTRAVHVADIHVSFHNSDQDMHIIFLTWQQDTSSFIFLTKTRH